VNLGLLAADNGVQAAVYYSTVRELVSARLLVRLETASGDRRRWYGRSGAKRIWVRLRLRAQGYPGDKATDQGWSFSGFGRVSG
jgi:hypothetical protein